MARIPIGTALRESIGFVSPAWRLAGGALALAVVSNGLFEGLRAGGVLSDITVAFLVLLIQTLIGTLVIGALYRSALTPDHGSDYQFRPGPAGLQWGSLEWRVLGANFLVGLILGTIVFVFFILWIIGFAVLGAAHLIDIQALQAAEQEGQGATAAAFGQLLLGPVGIVTLLIVGPGLILTLFLGARLSLYAVRAADTGSFDMGRAWALTQGASVTMMVSLFLLILLALVFSVGALLLGGFLAGALHTHTGWTSARLWTSVVLTAIIAAIGPPLNAGLVTYVYRTQRGGGTAIADQFS